MPQAQPELKKVSHAITVIIFFFTNRKLTFFTQYMEKRIFCQLNGNRKVIGVLRGYDVRTEPRIRPSYIMPEAPIWELSRFYGRKLMWFE